MDARQTDLVTAGVTAPRRATTARASTATRTGRPYDHSGDAAILASTLDLVAERGYERVSLDGVAARTGKAKTTLYRRWTTKEELVLAAIRAAGQPPEAESLPDTGSLRGDLIAVIDSPWLGGAERRSALFSGLLAAAQSSKLLADAVHAEVTAPYVDIYRRLLWRAHGRGDIPARLDASIPVLAEVIPAMSSHRLGSGPDATPRSFFVSVVDDVVLAALGVRRTS